MWACRVWWVVGRKERAGPGGLLGVSEARVPAQGRWHATAAAAPYTAPTLAYPTPAQHDALLRTCVETRCTNWLQACTSSSEASPAMRMLAGSASLMAFCRLLLGRPTSSMAGVLHGGATAFGGGSRLAHAGQQGDGGQAAAAAAADERQWSHRGPRWCR